MITHIVIFRTKKDEHRPALLEGLKTLAPIKTLKSYNFGTALESVRPVADDTYAAALCATFADADALNAYQLDPVHLKFNEEIVSKYKIKVQVFEFVS